MNLENELAKFNPKQKQLLFRNLMGVELTKGCSVRCPDCGLGALKGVNGKTDTPDNCNILRHLKEIFAVQAEKPLVLTIDDTHLFSDITPVKID